jgi:PTH1 family peptidyl-tRNA hydrolase
VDAREAERLFQQISVENTIIEIKVKGDSSKIQALVREVQVARFARPGAHRLLQGPGGREARGRDPDRAGRRPERGAAGRRHPRAGHPRGAGALPPDQIPESIQVDVTALQHHDSLHISDLKVAEGDRDPDGRDRTLCWFQVRARGRGGRAPTEAPVTEVIGAEEGREARRSAEGASLRPRPLEGRPRAGNPGPRYDATRHNVGWWVVDRLAHDWSVGPSGRKGRAVGAGRFRGRVRAAAQARHLHESVGRGARVARSSAQLDPTRDLLVVVDDAALDVGRVRFRPRGSAGGHNGLKSVEAVLGTVEYPRLRIGVGTCPPGEDLADWVLSPMSGPDEEVVVGLLPELARVPSRPGSRTAPRAR